MEKLYYVFFFKKYKNSFTVKVMLKTL